MTTGKTVFTMKLQGPDVRPWRVRLDDFLRLGQEVLSQE
jgi:hypothetical protein